MTSEEKDNSFARKSFEHFMLTGRVLAEEEPKTSHSPLLDSKLSSSNSAREKNSITKLAHHVQIAVDGFNQLFVNEWLVVDDRMLQVVESIANLRERIWIETCQQEQSSRQQNAEGDVPWEGYGYRKVGFFLSKEDVDMALDHSLLAHERMSSALRQGLAQLHQTQEMLGRRLDNVLQRFNSFLSSCNSNNNSPLDAARLTESLGRQVEDCLEIYRASACALLQKQLAAQDVLDSVNDSLLYHQVGISELRDTFENKSSARQVAHQVAKQWSRGDRKSALFHLDTLINQIVSKEGGKSPSQEQE